MLKQLIKIKYKVDTQCQLYNYVSNSVEDYFSYLSVDTYICANQNNIDINTLIELFKKPHLLEDFICPSCNENNCVNNVYDIIESSDLFIIYCNAFKYNRNIQSTRKIVNIKLKNIPNKPIIIGNIKYKFSSAIFHIEQSITNGHYTSIIKTNDGFFECNDTEITPCKWPTNSVYKTRFNNDLINLYLLIYEKIDNTHILTNKIMINKRK